MLRLGLILVLWAFLSAFQAFFNLEGLVWDVLSGVVIFGASFFMPNFAWTKALKWYWKISGLVVVLFAFLLTAIAISRALSLLPLYSMALLLVSMGGMLILIHFLRKILKQRRETNAGNDWHVN